MTSHNLDRALWYPKVLGKQLNDCSVGLPVDRALLYEHHENLAIRGCRRLHERAFAAARFHANGYQHGSRLAGGVKTGRHPVKDDDPFRQARLFSGAARGAR